MRDLQRSRHSLKQTTSKTMTQIISHGKLGGQKLLHKTVVYLKAKLESLPPDEPNGEWREASGTWDSLIDALETLNDMYGESNPIPEKPEGYREQE